MVCRIKLIFVQVVKVEVEQSCRLINILVIQGDKTISKIKWNGGCVGIDGDESAASLVVGSEITLNKVKQCTSNILAFY